MLEILDYFSSLALLELIAMVTALIYVVLAAKGNIYCWPAALISTLLYTFIFYDFYLWMDSLLQVYYMGMAFYGWYCWRQAKNDQLTTKPITKYIFSIQQWAMKTHVISIVLLAIASVLVGWLMEKYTPTDFPYLDSATTVFAIFATYLITQKVLENWLYWVVIDLLSIYIYVQKGLTPTAVLFVLYVILAVYGYIKWAKILKNQSVLSAARKPELACE